jgi:hypothetical protein
MAPKKRKAAPPKTAAPVGPSTRKLHENIGHDLRMLVGALPGTVTYEDEQRLGKLVVGLITSAIKADLPGRQTDAQVKSYLQEAQQGFARKLHRKVEALTPVQPIATEGRVDA